MSLKIKNIYIKAFRGIPCLELPLEQNSLLIIGENGTGKSSIVDAIDFFFSGKVSSLKGIQEIKLNRHVPHKNYDKDEVKIELSFSNNEKLFRTFTLSPSPSSFLKSYFSTAQNGTFILRRKQLLNFIDVIPSKRFEAITNLIGIAPLTNIEREMQKAKNTLKKELEQKNIFLNNIIHDISKIVGGEIKRADDVLPILNSLLQKNDLPTINSFEDVSKHNEKLFRVTKNPNEIDMFTILQEIIKKSNNIVITEELCKRINDLNNEVSLLMKDNLKETFSLLETLKTGRNYLKNNKTIKTCPLCEQNVDRESLLEQINTRYNNLEDLTIKFSMIQKESSKLSNEINSIIIELRSITLKMNVLTELKSGKDNLLKEIDILEQQKNEFEASKEDVLQIPSVDFIKEAKQINIILNGILLKSKELESKIELNDEDKKILEFVEMITKATSKINDLKKADDDLKTSTGYFKIAEKIYDKFSSLKSIEIQNIFDSIKTDIQKYYSFLHPDDPHSNIDLKIIGKGTSAVLKIESFGRSGEDPRAYSSEGHLDTLGLCIFLAFVKKFNQNCSLIIFDDIVTTVDSAHRESICRLLFEEFKGKQFIITTHDGLWFKQIVSLIEAYGLGNNFLKYEIYQWNEDNGPSIKSYKFKWERIPEKIKSGDKSCAGNEIRQYLEWVLENICKETGAKLPLIDHGYTVGDLIGPARSTLKKLIRDDETNKEIREAFKEIDKSIMGNLLSHHNELSANASIQDVKRFFEAVNKLHMLVSCPSCKQFLIYDGNIDRGICPKRCSVPDVIETNQIS
jgi:AAA15 family ATPase/GTPase